MVISIAAFLSSFIAPNFPQWLITHIVNTRSFKWQKFQGFPKFYVIH